MALSQVGWHQANLGEALGTTHASCEAALALHRRHHNRDGAAVNPGLPPPVKRGSKP